VLSRTHATAKVNGVLSSAAEYHAGIRQGCPLAPLLYLFIAWALSCWLRECPDLGVEVTPGLVVRCMLYADDVWALLRDIQQPTVQRFLEAMAVFATASNQHLNTAKSEILLVGDTTLTAPAPAEVSGIRVVSTESFGITFSNSTTASPATNWQDLLNVARNCYTKLAKLPLSMWGRATASATYGISQLFFQAEIYSGAVAGGR
jgi:hypothetical protein